MLSEADMVNKRLLSGRADQIGANNAQLLHYTVAVVAAELEGAVAAMQPARGGQGGRTGRQQRSCQQRCNQRSCGGVGSGQNRSSEAQGVAATPMLLAKQSAGLCDSY